MNSAIDRTKIPKPAPPGSFHFPDFQRKKMDNGLPLIVAEKHDLPLVNIKLCMHTSTLTEPEDKEGLAQITAEMMTEGTEHYNAEQLSEALEFLGAQYNAFADWNAIHVEINVSRTNIEDAFALLAEMVRKPIFPENALKRIIKEILVNRMHALDNPGKLAGEQFARMLYGNFRFGTPMEGTSKTIPGITIEDVRQFYDKTFMANNASLIFVGAINMSEARRLAEKHFKDWRTGKPPQLPVMNVEIPLQTKVTLVHRPGGAQSELRMGHLGISNDNNDRYAVNLMNEILGGYFLSRLNMNLREQHGYTYGVHSGFFYRKRTGPFVIASAIQDEFITDAIAEIINEIRMLRSEPVSDETFENARGYLMGVFPIVFETADQVAAGLSNIVIFNLPDDHYQTYRDKIAALTKQDIQQAAQKYLHPDALQIAVAGDRDRIEQTLADRFPLHIVDVYGNPIE